MKANFAHCPTALLLLSCALPVSPIDARPEEPQLFVQIAVEDFDDEWQPVFQGVDYRFDVVALPRPLRIHQTRIDTQQAGIEFFTTPSNGSEPNEVNSRKTTTFLNDFNLEAAINANAFEVFTNEGEPTGIIGLAVSNGEVVSPADFTSGNPVFLVTAANQARIIRAPFTQNDIDDAHNALQGWYGSDGMLVDDGVVVTIPRDINPRTAIGVSRDGRYVYFFVFDGRQSGFSEGVSLVEMAEWMKRIGCWDAMNLDGGGSSTLVLKNTDGTPLVMNSPSGGPQRNVANHIGVQALPLPIE